MNCSRRRFLQFAGTSFAVFATSATAVFAKPSKLISIPEPVERFDAVPYGDGQYGRACFRDQGVLDSLQKAWSEGEIPQEIWVPRTMTVTPDELTAMYRRNGKTELLDAMWQRGQIVVKPVPLGPLHREARPTAEARGRMTHGPRLPLLPRFQCEGWPQAHSQQAILPIHNAITRAMRLSQTTNLLSFHSPISRNRPKIYHTTSSPSLPSSAWRT